MAYYLIITHEKIHQMNLNRKLIAEKRSFKDYLGLILRGFFMGTADIVPGVSGGTIALITGIYEELILSIKSLDLAIIRFLFALKFKEVFIRVKWEFLISLFLGILLAVFSLARVITWLLVHQPVLLWSFFFGLVLASVYVVSRQIVVWDFKTFFAISFAASIAYVTVGLVPLSTPDDKWFVFISGGIATCAMILPGISGSFTLVILGKYQYILNAVNNRDFLTLAIFISGSFIGILGFARVLSWFFKKYHDDTIAMLTGLMLGSLRKIWPWKKTLLTITNRQGSEIPVEQVNILPSTFHLEVMFAVGLALLGLAIVLVLERSTLKKLKI